MEIPTGFMETQAHGFYIVTRPVYLKTALEVARRDPETLLSRAPSPGPMQGRGARVELPGEGDETIILKKQLRGGLFRRMKGDVHKGDYEAVVEIFLSETAWKKGVPVGQIAFGLSAPAGPGRLAAWRRGYTAAIKVPGARSLMEWLSSPLTETERRAVLRVAGEGIRRAHDRGLRHGDLNLGNILVARSERGEYGAWLIDLAHSEIGRNLTFKPRLANLVRLYRSSEKWLPEREGRRRFREIVRFLRAYGYRERGEARKYLDGSKRYRSSLFVHRLGWKASGGGAPGGDVRGRSSARAGR